MAFSAEPAGEEAEEEALPPAGGGAKDGGEVSTEEWRRWGTSSLLPAVVAAVVRELLEMEAKGGEKMSFGGVGSKLKVYVDDKSKWMNTAQLWTCDSGRDDTNSEKEDKERSTSEVNSHGKGGFVPFKVVGFGVPTFVPPRFRKYDKAYDVGMPNLSLLSLAHIKSTPAATIGAADESRRQVVGFAQDEARTAAMAPSGPNLNLQTQSQQQRQARKARQCWSSELHRKFVAALQQFGGPQVATPKQIRELMKVDSLTNDEVKSHLQKYRLEGIVV